MVHHKAEPGQDGIWLTKTVEALTELRAKVKPAGPVTVVLPPHLSLMKMLNTPRVAAAKRDKIINFEGQQSIPYPLSDVVWDRIISGENPHSFNVLLCAAKLDVLDPLSAAVAAAGMPPAGLLPAVRALAASFPEAQPARAPSTLLVEIGARSTTLVLMEKDAFQARTLPMGGIGVTQQIAETFACDFAQAEELKLDRERAPEIAPAVRVFAGRLAQEIVRTLGYFNRPIALENPLHVLLTGGGSNLPELASSLAAQLKMSVEVFEAAQAIELGREVREFRREVHGSTMAAIVGAAALQLRGAPTSLNLLPPRFRQQAGRRRLRPWLAVAAGFTIAGIVPAVVHYDRALVGAREENVRLERELAPLRAAEARAQEQRQRRAETQRRREAWRQIENARTAWLRFLGEIQAKFAGSGDVWIEQMHLEPSPAENTSAKTLAGTPLRLAISGRMQTKRDAQPSADMVSYRKVRTLLEGIASIPTVAAVENEHLESAPAGLLRFDFVVVLRDSGAL